MLCFRSYATYLSCTGRTHDGQDVSPLDSTGDIRQDILFRVALANDKVDVLESQNGTLHAAAGRRVQALYVATTILVDVTFGGRFDCFFHHVECREDAVEVMGRLSTATRLIRRK
jgi:hypothetical protein